MATDKKCTSGEAESYANIAFNIGKAISMTLGMDTKGTASKPIEICPTESISTPQTPKSSAQAGTGIAPAQK